MNNFNKLINLTKMTPFTKSSSKSATFTPKSNKTTNSPIYSIDTSYFP